MNLIERRHFQGILGALGLATIWNAGSENLAGGESGKQPEVLRLSRNGWMPNNERLPVLVYRAAIGVSGSDPASRFEQIFERNGWPAQWSNGIYNFHHYHSTAHEVLGFASGHARIMLGGKNGREVTLRAGDVALLPVGTGHCRIDMSSDLLVVGAYPKGQSWDLCRAAPDAAAIERMRVLPFAKSDPVSGDSGPLSRLWTAP
jgi:uncharacterized protein YjlB